MSERDQVQPVPAEQGAPSGATAYGASPGPDATVPAYSSGPTTTRQDPVASLLLLVAGIAAGISLLLPWLADDEITGMTLVREGFAASGDGVSEVIGTGYVQPLTIVLGGGVLFLLGLLLLVPARSHRIVGLLALVVAVLVAVAVLVPLAIAGWDVGFFGSGFWFAIAVAVLGLIGSLKALFTRAKRT